MKKPFLHQLHDYFFPHLRNNHRPNIFSLMSVAALVLAVVIFEAGYLVQTKIVFLKTDFLASVLPGALVALTNEDRAARGLRGVTENTLLSIAAQAAAEDMAAKGYFAHASPDGKTPWYWLEQVGYRYSYAGENLAVNFTDSENVEMAWMASPTHRANIVKPQYTEVGFGTANGMYEGQETTFVVEFFAAPASIAVAPTTVAVAPPKKAVTSTVPVSVLGSETSVSAAPAAGAAPVAKIAWFTSLLASPLSILLTILSVLFFLVTISFTVTLLVRKRVQHPSVVLGGAFLLLLIMGAMLAGSSFAGSVQLPAGGQAASVYLAVP